MNAKLSLKFYIVTIILIGLVLFGWYALYFLNTNEILMGDDTPMDFGTKMAYTIASSIILLSWSLSAVTLIRQIILGVAFRMDENGIHDTATGINILAFLFIVPVKTITFEAIEELTEENGVLMIKIDKSKIRTFPLLKPFVRKRYFFFSGFTKETTSNIKNKITLYMKNHSK